MTVTKENIVEIMKIRGPSLPVHISQATGINSLFAGAFLSELLGDKIIRISNMKVGGSPLYYLPGQEEQLEKFYTYMPGKEKEAFLLLKEKKILEDDKLEPAIRVALRSIKDFSFPLVLNHQDSRILFWRFHSFAESQAKEMIELLINSRKPVQLIIPSQPVIQPEIPQVKIEQEIIKEIISEFPAKVHHKPDKSAKVEKEKPLITLKPEKKPQEKSDFVNKVISSLESENIEILEEIGFKKKEYSAIVRINSDLGKIKFLAIAKEKKAITENDLALALSNTKIPLLFITPGEPNKKALAYLEQNSSVVKFKKLS